MSIRPPKAGSGAKRWFDHGSDLVYNNRSTHMKSGSEGPWGWGHHELWPGGGCIASDQLSIMILVRFTYPDKQNQLFLNSPATFKQDTLPGFPSSHNGFGTISSVDSLIPTHPVREPMSALIHTVRTVHQPLAYFLICSTAQLPFRRSRATAAPITTYEHRVY